MEVIDWLIGLASVITGIATVVLAVITRRYVRLTNSILEENRLMRLDAHKPEIAVSLCLQRDVTPSIRHVILRIENIGAGPARDVKFITDFSLKRDDVASLESIDLLKNGITYFGHGRTIGYMIADGYKLDKLKKHTPIEITVTYTDSAKREYEDTFHLDFGVLKNSWREVQD